MNHDELQSKLKKFRKRNNDEDIVLYSYKSSKHDHINEHEMNRLEHSIGSLRKHNTEIPIYLFCDVQDIVPKNFKEEYDVILKDFDEDFDHNMLNSWSIHRWYNMKHFENIDCNILYVDSDTVFYGDVQYLFDTYCSHDIYGREERGFRHCPITGSSKNIRYNLDMVDVCIYESGGKEHVYKYCCGVLLMNNNLHKRFINRLDELTELMEQIRRNEIENPIPNPRISDQYGVWNILSRVGASCGLFGIQDVTQSYLEHKHEEYFNPIILHYTTKDEQEFSTSEHGFSDLIRDVDELGDEIDPYSTVVRIM